MNLELFSCSGGMAEGFRRAGIEFDLVFDADPNACDSYAMNLGHRPVQMDVRDLLRMILAGWSPGQVDLLVADPPCTPWSRAGKRLGTEDERDMLLETVELIRRLLPRVFVIGNVPGLDDSNNWPTVQRVIGGLSREGYHVDFARLDAADYGVPQHRVRPFWIGHPWGSSPCMRWPEATHGDPTDPAVHSPLHGELRSWVTCREALGHLSLAELGRPVKLRKRGQHSEQHGSIGEKPARVVGTSNLSDGNVLVPSPKDLKDGRAHRHPGKKPRASRQDEPAGVVTTRENGDGNQLILNAKHPPSALDAPSSTLTGGGSGHSANQKLLLLHDRHPVNEPDAPSFTVTSKGDGRGAQGACVMDLRPKLNHRRSDPDEPAKTLTRNTHSDGSYAEWPWPRPATTVQADPRLAPPGHHDETERAATSLSSPDAIVLSERAAAILQGFPEGWLFSGPTKSARQIGQAMPIALAQAVATGVAEILAALQLEKAGAV